MNRMIEKKYSYRFVYTDRKSISIEVKGSGEVIVHAPRNVEASYLEDVLLKHEKWIKKKQADAVERMSARKSQDGDIPQEFCDGAVLRFYDRKVRLKVKRVLNGNRISMKIRAAEPGECSEEWILEAVLPCVLSGPSRQNMDAHLCWDITNGCWKERTVRIEQLSEDEKRTECERLGRLVSIWYRNNGLSVFERCVEKYADEMNVTYERISVKEQKTRWGSCSQAGNLNFNWKLLLLPERLLDYVVVHELAHRIEMNHSAAFWTEVFEILPDYEQRRTELKQYAYICSE